MIGASWLAIAGCGGPPAPPPQRPVPIAQPERLNRIVERYWNAYLAQNPLRATAVGEHRFDDRLGNPAAIGHLAASLALERSALAELLALPLPAPDTPERVTYEVFKFDRELAIEGYTYPEELFPVNPFEGVAQEFARLGAGQGGQPFATEKDYDRWFARSREFAAWAKQAADDMRDGLRRGYVAPRALVEELLPQLAGFAADTPANPFYAPLKNQPDALAAGLRARMTERFKANVRETILPAYRGLHDFIQNDYLPLARDVGGLQRLPLGDAWYAHLVRRETTTRMTPAQIHRLGLTEVARLHGRVQALIAAVGFLGDAGAYLDVLRRDPRYVRGAGDDALQPYRDLQTKVIAAAGTVLADLPDALEIGALDGDPEPSAPPLRYRPAAPDGRHGAMLLVDTANPLTGVSFLMEPLFLNASVPGRHAQWTVQQGDASLPRFRRFGRQAAFVEGWSLYAESLGEEMGLYTEPETRFAALLDELQQASMLVVDTGLHGQSWTRRQAIDYLRAQWPLEESRAAAAVDRALALPARALAAEVGALRLHALRTHAQETLGARFDLRAFHGAVLQGGSVPLDLLEPRIDRWIAATEAAPLDQPPATADRPDVEKENPPPQSGSN